MQKSFLGRVKIPAADVYDLRGTQWQPVFQKAETGFMHDGAQRHTIKQGRGGCSGCIQIPMRIQLQDSQLAVILFIHVYNSGYIGITPAAEGKQSVRSILCEKLQYVQHPKG